jgi:hypothetical protein
MPMRRGNEKPATDSKHQQPLDEVSNLKEPTHGA